MDFISKIYYFFYFASYTEETKSCWVDNQIEAIRWAAKGGSNILYSIFRNWYALLNSPKKGLTLSTSSNARDGAHLPFGFTNLVTNLESSTTNIITFELGRALYFYFYIYRDSSIQLTLQHQLFMKKCLKYYHESLNLQQKSIFTFLWCWRMILGKYGGAREVVNIIAQMLWTNRDLYPCLDFMQF